jgi:hypothetical protein
MIVNITVVYPWIGKKRKEKVPNNYFNVYGILGGVTLKFWEILAFL